MQTAITYNKRDQKISTVHFLMGIQQACRETFERCSILFKFKDNDPPQADESDAEIGQKGTFCKGLADSPHRAS